MKRDEKATILIVDDKPANLLVLESLLSKPDRSIIKAVSGKDALRIALEDKVDLIVLDVQMPEMDGFEVAQILNSNKKTRDVPVIFATAEKKEHASMMKGFEEGAVDYLFKPLDPEITKAKVAVLLKVHLQKKELIEKNILLEKSALLINNSADIIGIVDGTTLKIEEMNHAFSQITGYGTEEVRNTSMLLYLNDEDKTLVQKLRQGAETKISFEGRFQCKNHNIIWLEWNVVIKYDKWFVNARDISEQKSAAEQITKLNRSLERSILQLESANKELESFSYSVSHDLRAPLRALYGNAEVLLEDYGHQLDAGGTRVIEKLKSNVSRMDQLIKDLLSFSKIGKKELRKSEVDMASQVKEIVAETGNEYRHQTEITVHALPPAYGDQSMLRQVWTNLISNAFKYTSRRDNARIEIGVRQTAEGFPEYFVKDNGSGFDMRYADKLFGTFQRLHDATEFEGTGIGLAIVQRIIFKHGGTIRAEALPDKGATFYFTIPG